MGYRTIFHAQISDFSALQWSDLCRHAGPFLSYNFLSALEAAGCVGADTGWEACHLGIYNDDELVAAMPGYIKYDSYGEYVFDQSWAAAYHEHGFSYYPKWVSAIPFTPVTGPRLLTLDTADMKQVAAAQTEALASLEYTGISSSHILFANADQAEQSVLTGFLPRHSVQFQWHNYQYATFADFLDTLTSRKRKALKKSRRNLDQQGVTISRYIGRKITAPLLDFFYTCYQRTYLKRSGHGGYLNQTFFSLLFETMPDNLMLVVAEIEGAPVASALFFFDESGLFGRYWGAIQEIDGLHFECCYFKGIEFAIDYNLPIFNPGTQGEHKILRGFEPIYCTSLHKLHRFEFHQAVADFLARETPAVVHYFHQAKEALPYKQSFTSTLKATRAADPNPAPARKQMRTKDEI